jgi:hypothetical protein
MLEIAIPTSVSSCMRACDEALEAVPCFRASP